MASELSDIPHNMRRLYRRFERWRSAHTGRLPIPARLWTAAAELAREHGLFPTAKTLHLEYGKLKQLADAPVPALKGRVAKGSTALRQIQGGTRRRTAVLRRTRSQPRPPAFVELLAPRPGSSQECRFVLESFRDVYAYEAEAKRRGLLPEERLRFHQEHSQPVMDALHAWFEAQFVEKKVEPNSGLGEAITYCLKRWDRLTLFLRQAGAPLDSNIVERALKKCILHRKNSLFYKTEKGAEVGDLFMSLTHTCELNDVNPFDYLTELQNHAEELAKNPAAWMPWNYRETLEQTGTSHSPA